MIDIDRGSAYSPQPNTPRATDLVSLTSRPRLIGERASALSCSASRRNGVRGYATWTADRQRPCRGAQSLPVSADMARPTSSRRSSASVRELEQRVAEAEREVERIARRRHECAEWLATLRQRVEDVPGVGCGAEHRPAWRQWAPRAAAWHRRRVERPHRRGAGRRALDLSPSGTGAPPAARGRDDRPHDAGAAAMTDTIEALDAEIARLQAEIVNIERMQPTVAERFAAAEAELRDANSSIARTACASLPRILAETAYLQRQAVIGALHGGRRRQAAAGRARSESRPQGEGLSAADKRAASRSAAPPDSADRCTT